MASDKESSSRTRSTPPAQPVQREGYPWGRVVFGCLLVLGCWGVGLYREYREEVDLAIRRVQDWQFSKLWPALSPMSALGVDPFRKPLWAQVQGSVLEIGSGLGEPLRLLPPASVDKYVALEPNVYLHPQLAENARAAGFAVEYDEGTCPGASQVGVRGSGVPLTIVNGTLDWGVPEAVQRNGPYDVVIASLVLCSVDDPAANLRAAQDLLVPGGKFIFVEHVHHTDENDMTVGPVYVPGSLGVALWRRIQSNLSPVWSLFTGNCHLDRETGRLIGDMEGWSQVEINTHRGTNGFLAKLMPLIYGVAIKAPAE
ncbi:hypothetical protein GGF46_004758 [Coemansia sp. RSA 552]|nr:hypothetical protein GGF46_004758 [Coemansia sp. RSA 552]